ncbi:Transcription termination factor MTERF2, chloroplastic [Porphyridium purpureum]|uniref:Transcription termination factor MTERF2, chloroplastic n=1 Tax=Porphyridium purpureum TaxID=35688 RepID=A0A5J4YPU3_PORPP|nr:Transcription termination factor MTERF2, chloroplastic [Porphyridium purpureum]|eukprot:POR8254..scf295_9
MRARRHCPTWARKTLPGTPSSVDDLPATTSFYRATSGEDRDTNVKSACPGSLSRPAIKMLCWVCTCAAGLRHDPSTRRKARAQCTMRAGDRGTGESARETGTERTPSRESASAVSRKKTSVQIDSKERKTLRLKNGVQSEEEDGFMPDADQEKSLTARYEAVQSLLSRRFTVQSIAAFLEQRVDIQAQVRTNGSRVAEVMAHPMQMMVLVVLEKLAEQKTTGRAITKALRLRPEIFVTPVAKVEAKMDWLMHSIGMSADQALHVLCTRGMLECRLGSLQEKERFLLSESVGMTPEQVAAFVIKVPAVLSLSLTTGLEPRIQFLRSIGVAQDDIGRAMLRAGRTMLVSVEKLQDGAQFLLELGVPQQKLASIFMRSTDFFAYQRPTIERKLAYFREELEFSRDAVAQLIIRSPGFVGSSLQDTLVPLVEYLASTLYFSKHDVGKTLERVPALVGLRITNIDEKVRFFIEEAGFHEPPAPELREFLLSQPYVFTLSVSKNLRPKLHFFLSAGVLSRNNDTRIAARLSAAWYFFHGLTSRIIPRFRYIRHVVHEAPVEVRSLLSLDLLCTVSDAEFERCAAEIGDRLHPSSPPGNITAGKTGTGGPRTSHARMLPFSEFLRESPMSAAERAEINDMCGSARPQA